MFVDKLIERIKACRNHTVVGLDPRLEYVPEHILRETAADTASQMDGTGYAKAVADAFWLFNKGIIDQIHDIVPAVKPQIAFYEQYGLPGLACFEKTCAYAGSKGLLVIGDVKRGDIGSTAEAYSEYYLGGMSYSAATDCITVNPYLGSDSLEPFIKDCNTNGKGIFILVKTSNKSSVDIQDLVSDGKRVYEHVAELVVRLGEGCVGSSGYSSVGAVVGATFKADAEKLRKRMERSYFLVPGYGAQGGTAADVAACFNDDGLGAVINSSRGIIAAYKSEAYSSRYGSGKFAAAAREAALDMQKTINGELEKLGKLAW